MEIKIFGTFCIIFACSVAIMRFLSSFFRRKFVVSTEGGILITGSSSGIGRHAAIYLATKYPKFTIFASVRSELDIEKLRLIGPPNIFPVLLDVNSPDSRKKAFGIIEQYLKLHQIQLAGIVLNAGVARNIVAELHSIDDARNVFETNFFSIHALVQDFLPMLRTSKGRILFVSSVAGFVSVPLASIYSASKWALEGYADSLRREIAHFGIAVAIIQPAYIKSSIYESGMEASNKTLKTKNENEDILQLYNKFYSVEAIERKQREVQLASAPIVTSTAIEHALFSIRPLTRYLVGNAGGVPASVLRFMTWILSDSIQDSYYP